MDQSRMETLVGCSNSLDVNKVDVAGNTLLHNAMKDGNLYVVQAVLEHKNIEVNKQAIDGATPLYIASQEQHTEIVSLLIKAWGLQINKGNAEGVSPLQVAAKNGHLTITTLLLSQNDIDPNQADYQDITPLIAAANEGQLQVVTQILMHPKIEVNKATWNGMTALFYACKQRQLEVVRVLLSCPRTDITLLDENGKDARAYAENRTAIIHNFDSQVSLIRGSHSCCSDEQENGIQIAAQDGDWRKTKAFLLCPGMNINEGYESDLTPLYLAVREEKIEVVKVLLEFPTINVNQIVNGENALLVATELGNLALVETLLGHPEIDTNIVKRGDQGNSLYIASKRGFNEIVRQFLVQSQIEVNNVFGSKRQTALIAATAANNLKIIEMLLLCPKVDMNITDLYGKSPIQLAANLTLNMFMMREEFLQNETHTCCNDANDKLITAAEMGDHKAIRGLAQCPTAKINIKDFKGRTPLYLASMMNNLKAVGELLAVTSIDPNKGRNLDEKTPFSISSENGHFKVMEQLLNHSKVNVNKGWVFDNWPSHVEKATELSNNSAQDISGSYYEGGVFLQRFETFS